MILIMGAVEKENNKHQTEIKWQTEKGK